MNLVTSLSIDPFNWTAVGTAIFIGFIIGLERQVRGKPVGIRTSILIILGTYIFVFSASLLNNGNNDTTRIIGQVITGIGFLGAGVILTKEASVLGVTSAAAIWALAALGVCVALGYYITSIKLALLMAMILVGVDVLESYFQALTKGVHEKIKAIKRVTDE